MRLLIVTDAWLPQVNGVVRTHQSLKKALESKGIEICHITPSDFWTVPCPSYPEIRLSVFAYSKIARTILSFRPEAIHISTEGPLGLAARKFCVRHDIAFTTAYHTRFPEYIEARTKIPARFTRGFMKWFHAPAQSMMVATESLSRELRSQGFENVLTWTRGIDVTLFRPQGKLFSTLKGPIFMYVGRVAVEKNIEAFLKLDLPGTKIVVGDGPQLKSLQTSYRDVIFTGLKEGKDLARHYASADVFVFPSKTDTFGLVLLEALASGVPVAAYPVTGPVDVIGNAPVGCLDPDLKTACLTALNANPADCRAFALNYSWETCAEMFLNNLAKFEPETKNYWKNRAEEPFASQLPI